MRRPLKPHNLQGTEKTTYYNTNLTRLCFINITEKSILIRMIWLPKYALIDISNWLETVGIELCIIGIRAVIMYTYYRSFSIFSTPPSGHMTSSSQHQRCCRHRPDATMTCHRCIECPPDRELYTTWYSTALIWTSLMTITKTILHDFTKSGNRTSYR